VYTAVDYQPFLYVSGSWCRDDVVCTEMSLPEKMAFFDVGDVFV